MAEQNKLAAIDRFTNAVVACYGDTSNGIDLSKKEVDIIKGYFMQIDLALKNSKDGYSWGMVDLKTLAPRLKHYARLGLDMQLPNHLSPVPFRSGNSKFITMNLIPGYEGRKYLAMKFAVNPPKDIVAYLVGSNDNFKPIRRDANHDHDDYIFEENPFNHGDIIGGFAYTIYDDPSLNKLTVMSLDEIKKHMPKHGSSFWTGDWKTSMWKKTLIIAACKDIPLDAEKIRNYQEDFEQIRADELNNAAETANAEAYQKMNTGDFIDIDFQEAPESELGNSNDVSTDILE